ISTGPEELELVLNKHHYSGHFLGWNEFRNIREMKKVKVKFLPARNGLIGMNSEISEK
ncbi:7614_t:CDS:2, partial [Gigaspora margarita]